MTTTEERIEMLEKLGFERVRYPTDRMEFSYINEEILIKDIEVADEQSWKQRYGFIVSALRSRGIIYGKCPMYFMRDIDGRWAVGSEWDGLIWSNDFNAEFGFKSEEQIQEELKYTKGRCIEIVKVYV